MTTSNPQERFDALKMLEHSAPGFSWDHLNYESSVKDATKPSQKQIGGAHYKHFVIQPIEFCYKNKLNNCQSEAISYICRAPLKNGKQDVEKAIHTLQLWLEMWE